MTQLQQGDVALTHTGDGGEICVENGLIAMGGGLETSVYLSLFGGNERDNGQDNNPFNWWGNLDENDPAFMYRSEVGNLVVSLPATSGNLRRVEDAARRDLEWLIEVNAATSIEVLATIPDVNKLALFVEINIEGEEQRFEFIENWKVST